ncbi:MAG: SEC-C domain-containing protein, partial [Calditrichaeota bacterium]|nr:SEC-C domain-containing protein [Calditrichota bacterium]
YDYIKEEALKMYDYKTEKVGETLQKEIERWWSLRIIDDNWKDHLHMMDMLKEGINLRAYGQKDPLIEYKREAFEMFQDLIDRVNQQTLEKLWTTELVQVPSQHKGGPSRLMLVHRDATNMGLSGQGQGGETAIQKAARESREQKKTIKVDTKVGRNDPCPCGSGKKYKKCHGAGVA